MPLVAEKETMWALEVKHSSRNDVVDDVRCVSRRQSELQRLKRCLDLHYDVLVPVASVQGRHRCTPQQCPVIIRGITQREMADWGNVQEDKYYSEGLINQTILHEPWLPYEFTTVNPN